MSPSPKRRLPAVTGRSPDLSALYCRPTRLGLGLLVTIVLLWLVGLNYQVNLAYAAAFWLAGFAVVAVLTNLRQLLALQIDIKTPSEIFAGNTAALTLNTPNNTRRRWLWLCNEDDFINAETAAPQLWQPWSVGSDDQSVYIWQVPTLRRGCLRVPPLRTASVAPFGMSMVQCVWQWPGNTIVYPAPIPHEHPISQKQNDGTDKQCRSVQGGDDPAYLQPHQNGMPLQHVAWKAFAKTGEMLDKRFEEQQHTANHSIISYLDYPAGTPTDRLAGLLCFRVLEAERRGQPYILELPQKVIAPQKGQREICLTALALW